MRAEVIAAAKTHFGLDTAELTSLGSCQDLNYKLKTTNGHVFVVKYTNPSVSAEDVRFQHSVKRFLLASSLVSEVLFPEPTNRVDSPSESTVVQVVDGQLYTMHVLSYVKGKLLSDFSYYPEETLKGFGRIIAQLSAVLKAYPEATRPRKSEWDLRGSVDLCESHSVAMLDTAERSRWLSLVRYMDDLVREKAGDLRIQLVHGDLAPYNVVADISANGRPHVKGVIDFGDVTETWLVGELAIAIVPFFAKHTRRPLDYVQFVVQGFCSVTPLTCGEAYALWPMIVMRIIALYVSIEGLLSSDSSNEYLRSETAENRKAAEFIASIPLEEGICAVVTAAGLTYSPRVVQGTSVQCGLLGQHEDLRELDLSASSLWYGPGDWLDATHCLARVCASATAARTPCGEPWLCMSSVRSLDAPPTTPTFSLLRLPADACILNPASGAVRRFSIDPQFVGSPLMTSFLEGRGVKEGLEVSFQGWSLRVVVVDGQLVSTDDILEAGAALVSPGSTVLVQASVRTSTLLPLSAPPLFVTQANWALQRFFTVDVAALLAPSSAAAIPPALCSQTREMCEDTLRSVLAARNSHVAACQEHYFQKPTQIERAYRTFMYDTSCRAYLDLVNNVAVVGHCHEKLTAAMHNQAQLLNTNSRFVYGAMAKFAQHILSLVPADIRAQGKLNKVFFVNSGSEATDLALRIARTVSSERVARSQGLDYANTLNRHTLCMQGGYHGITVASDEVSTTLNDNPRSLETRAPWIHLLAMPNRYRGVFRSDSGDTEEQLAAKYAALSREKIAELAACGVVPAVLIAEPLSGNAGGVEIPMGYLQQLYEMVRAAGGLCISDEVQVGYGRLGNHFWGFQEHGVVPDIITMAKAAGNGQPLGYVIVSEDIVAEFRASQGSFFSSAGGGPVSCAIGSAVLDIIHQDDLQNNAKEVGAYLNSKLKALQAKYPGVVGCIHGHGLYQGVELVRVCDRIDGEVPTPATAEAYAICERLLELGVINHNTGDYSNVLKVKPPLYFSKEDADFFVEALDIALGGW